MTGVYALGSGVVPHEACQDVVFEDAIRESARRALDDAELERSELDSVMMAGYDVEVGRSISNMYVVSPAGGYLRDEGRITEDGLFALAAAITKIVSGGYDVVMLTAYCFPESSRMLIDNLSYDPLYVRDLGMSEVTANAIQAERYATETRDADAAARGVVEKNLTNGWRNPNAHRTDRVTADEAAEAAVVATPFREYDVPPESYGVVSVVLSVEEYAARYGDPVRVEGIGWNNDTYYLGEKDLTRSRSLENAAKSAYDAAGITAPRDELDVVELTEVSSYHELIAYEALGLCGAGEGVEFLESGATSPSGDVPVNTSGGTLSWDPNAASGLAGFVEVADQIRGRCGDRQIDGVTRGLAHGTGRNAMQTNAVAIVGESDV